MVGQIGVHKTLGLLSRSYWLPHLCNYIENYIWICDASCLSKCPRVSLASTVWVTSTLTSSWLFVEVYIFWFHYWSSTFQSFYGILTIVDLGSLRQHIFYHAQSQLIIKRLANLVICDMFQHHGLTNDIIRYRGPQFISKFWKHLLALLQIYCKLSSSYHPHIDGQNECTNQTSE